jgi:gentisate 1,2-dioxygenase
VNARHEPAFAEAKLMTDDEYYPSLLPKNIRPAIWRLAELEPKLEALLKDPLKRADRRFLSLVNGDTPADNPGVLPGLFCGIQGINPGEHILPHRHNSFALYHIMKGKGYSVVEGSRIDWSQGDTSSARPGLITSTSTTAPRSQFST